MSNQQTSPKITLEDIALRKAKLLEEIRNQQLVMASTARNIFAPLVPAASAGSTLMRSFNTGMAIFDGAMLGLKIMKKIRHFFERK